jgi:hypothetical protein
MYSNQEVIVYFEHQKLVSLFIFLSYTLSLHFEPLHQPFFLICIFLRKGLMNYFLQAGFELWSSWSLPPG